MSMLQWLSRSEENYEKVLTALDDEIKSTEERIRNVETEVGTWKGGVVWKGLGVWVVYLAIAAGYFNFQIARSWVEWMVGWGVAVLWPGV